MRFIKRILTALIAVLVLVLGILFTTHNTEKVAVDLFLIELPQASFSVWLIASLLLGVVLGLVLSSFALVRLRSSQALLRKQVSRQQSELAKLRAGKAKDTA